MILTKSNFLVEGAILLTIIIFLQLFSYTGIPENSLALAAGIFGLGMLMLLISFATILFKNGLQLNGIDRLVILFIAAIFISFFTAYAYWEQPVSSSLLSYRSFYIFFLYFVLVGFKISQKASVRIVIILFFLSLIIFSIDYVTFPEALFSLRSEERRDGFTIFFYGQGFTFLGAFYYLDKFLKKRNLFHLIWFLIGGMFLFFLTQSRMILLGLGLGSILILFLSNLRYKFLLAGVLVSSGILVYLSSGIFDGIQEQNAEQAKFYSEDIRVMAHEFFWNDLQGGWPTYVFGNGSPASGSKLEAITVYGQEVGFYTSDVGLTGIFSYFGFLGLIIWVLFFYKVFSVRDDNELGYVKAYFLSVLATAATGYSIFDPGYMPATVMGLYLIRCTINKTTTDSESIEQ